MRFHKKIASAELAATGVMIDTDNNIIPRTVGILYTVRDVVPPQDSKMNKRYVWMVGTTELMGPHYPFVKKDSVDFHGEGTPYRVRETFVLCYLWWW
jgi:hypothetical protein